MNALIPALGLTLIAATPVFAEGFERIEQRDGFLSLVQNKDLTRFGIRLTVKNDGSIEGRAFGREVTGDWRWDGGFFCRDLYLAGDPLDANNCQVVQVRGETLRFTSDRGTGDYADLRLD